MRGRRQRGGDQSYARPTRAPSSRRYGPPSAANRTAPAAERAQQQVPPPTAGSRSGPTAGSARADPAGQRPDEQRRAAATAHRGRADRAAGEQLGQHAGRDRPSCALEHRPTGSVHEPAQRRAITPGPPGRRERPVAWRTGSGRGGGAVEPSAAASAPSVRGEAAHRRVRVQVADGGARADAPLAQQRHHAGGQQRVAAELVEEVGLDREPSGSGQTPRAQHGARPGAPSRRPAATTGPARPRAGARLGAAAACGRPCRWTCVGRASRTSRNAGTMYAGQAVAQPLVQPRTSVVLVRAAPRHVT